MNDKKAGASYTRVLGLTVRRHREIRGINLTTMAKRMEMSVSGWSRVETGATTMTVDQLCRAAKAIKLEAWLIVKQAEEDSP